MRVQDNDRSTQLIHAVHIDDPVLEETLAVRVDAMVGGVVAPQQVALQFLSLKPTSYFYNILHFESS